MSFTDEQRAKGQATMRAKGFRNMGARGTHGKKRLEWLAKRKKKIIELRDAGHTLEEIRVAVGCKNQRQVREVLFNGVVKAERRDEYNERLLSFSHLAIDVIKQRIADGDEDVAMWLLEKTGTVGKEAINLTINAHNAVIPLNQDMIDAARMVATQMMSAPKSAPQLKPKEENSNGDTGVSVSESSESSGSIIDGEVTE
jgi:hypothetical protein